MLPTPTLGRRHSLACGMATLVLCTLLAAANARGDDAPATENPFPGKFPAPSLEGGVEWLNASGEISLKELRGKIVLLDFWTYCCINCIHVLPDLKFLEQKYPNQLVVIGVHSAKFENEKESENIRQAIMRYEIQHPVVNDANMTIARKYFFNSWPTFVLIDPEGNFVGRQPGEGNRELFDEVIGRMVAYHRAKGTLDESPLRFDLEQGRQEPTPLRYPGKLLADEAGNRLFVSDSNHNRIVVSTLDGQLLDVIGTGQIGRKDGAYAQASFDHPQGMALVGDKLYVADTENHLLRVIDLTARQVTSLAGTGEQSRGRFPGGPLLQTPLNSPWALCHLDGILYVAMAGPHQLWSHKLGTDQIGVVAGSGREDIIDGNLQDSALAQPSGITTDGQALYHVDSEGSAIRKVTLGANGEVTTVAGPHDLDRGASLFEFGDVDGVGDEVRMQHPLGIVHHAGRLYVADTYNDKIKVIDIASRKVETWLGTGTRGKQLDPVELSEPAGLSIAGGTLFIADTNNHRLLATDLKTKATREIVIQGLTPPPPPQPMEEEIDPASVQNVPEVAVTGKSLNVTVNFELPEGYKLNELANVSYRVIAPDKSSLVDAVAAGGRKRAQKGDKSATFTIPLTGQPGSESVLVSVAYQYCKDGTGAICRYGTQTWRVPLTVGANGSDQLVLTANTKIAE